MRKLSMFAAAIFLIGGFFVADPAFAVAKKASTTTVTCHGSTYTGAAQTPCTAKVTGVGGLNLTVVPNYTNNTNAGTATASYSFAGDDNHFGSSDSDTFKINQATPTLTVTNSPVVYNGATQSAVVVGSVPGEVSDVKYYVFIFSVTPKDAGTYSVVADFKPTDTANYKSLNNDLVGDFVINKATPILSVANSPVVYNGSKQSATVVSSVPGHISHVQYDNRSNEPSAVGTYAVTANFDPSNDNYNDLKDGAAGNFVIRKITPNITWADPADIISGTALSAIQLNAEADTEGGFAYTPSTGTVLNVGNDQTLHVDFTPANTTNYNTASKDVMINVKDITPPVITKEISGTLGTNGWYTSDMTVAWTVNDPESAVVIDSGCDVQNFTSETAGVVSPCVAHSAGGQASDSVIIKIDKTAPQLSFADGVKVGPVMSDNIAINFGDAAVAKYGFVGSAGDCITSMDTSGFDSYTDNFQVIEASQNGQYVCAYGEDAAGNKAAIASENSLNIDVTAPTITVNNPNTDPAQSKTITAGTNEGALSMAETSGSYCGSDMNFHDYTSVTFSAESDNGMMVCYKAEDEAGNTDYEMSNPIAGIDTTVPVASVTSPTNGSYLKGTVTLTADATDVGSRVQKVEFWNASIDTKIGETTIAPYSITWDTATVNDGEHNVWVVAYDNAGNQTTSETVSVTVDNTKPNGEMTAPVDGSTVRNGVTLSVSASDGESGSGVHGVSFYYGEGAPINDGEVTEGDDGVYSTTWNTGDLENGQYTLYGVITDNAGNSYTTDGVNVTLDNTALSSLAVAIDPSTVQITFNKALQNNPPDGNYPKIVDFCVYRKMFTKMTVAEYGTPEITTPDRCTGGDAIDITGISTNDNVVTLTLAAPFVAGDDPHYQLLPDSPQYIGTIIDEAGNQITEVTDVINDGIKPVITLIGEPTIILAYGASYEDKGATCSDIWGGSREVTTTGTVNTSVAGTYTIKYDCSDAAENKADQKTRTVTVNAPIVNQGDGGGGGGGGGSSGGSGYVNTGSTNGSSCIAVVAPDGGFKVGSGGVVNDRNVTLVISGGNAVKMAIANSTDFTGASIEPYATSKAWVLTDGFGVKMVFVRFYNSCGTATNAVGSIFYYGSAPQVLGTQAYADGTLLRGSNHKIYVVVNGQLVYITGPSQLRKYAGHEILNVPDSVITNWLNGSAPAVLGVQTYANGTLLRGPNHRIYVLVKGKLVYISSLKELAKYRGKKIYDVSAEVIAQYL